MLAKTFKFRSLALTVLFSLFFTTMALAVPVEKHDALLQNIKFTGDFDQMNKRHVIRALVVYNDMLYFFDHGRTRGASYEAMKLFEKFINKKLKKGTVKIRVVFIPTTRDRLLPDLIAGRGDLAAANLTITPERLKLVDFSDPFAKQVKEVVVTGPKAGKLTALEELSGQEIMVSKSSSYFEHLQNLNQTFIKNGLKPVKLKPSEKYLEDADLLEMVNSGILPLAIVDNHKAKFWAGVYNQLTVREDLAIHNGGKIAWAFRKNSPKLQEIVNQFVKKHRQGTLHGNIIINRYLKNNRWATNPNRKKEREKFAQTVKLFQENGKRYKFDYLMLMALAFQESQLDQNQRSAAGAIGIMQVLKSTASDPKVNIKNIEKIENNVNAGSKYLRFIYNNYYADQQSMDDLNKMLFSFASYNAGPRKISRMRKLAGEMGLDKNIWFNNVELAAAKKIGRETVQYVSNIYKYYIAYRLVEEQRQEKLKNN
ncbi:MAG: lytic transglycosylase F [Deltaproteobacteria bacterium]|nr:lytic transglycosylase F [Candidatus Tharpella sp.]